jgi:integrase-like protein
MGAGHGEPGGGASQAWAKAATASARYVAQPGADHKVPRGVLDWPHGKLHADARWRLFFTIALDTALRRGELVGLRWGDVDLLGRVLHVRRSIGAYDDLGEAASELTTRTEAGERLLVAAFAGHAKTSTTTDACGHLMQQRAQDAARRMRSVSQVR